MREEGPLLTIDDPAVVAEVTDAFHRYERALMDDDVAELDRLFSDAPTTIRYGPAESLYGGDAIRAFRRARGGSPPRDLTRVTITTFGRDTAVANAEFRRAGFEPVGRQSQTWVRFADGWKVVSAHVSFQSAPSSAG